MHSIKMASARDPFSTLIKNNKTNQSPASTQDFSKLDLQLLLSRESLSKTWNVLVRDGALSEAAISNFSVSRKVSKCLKTGFPCSCSSGGTCKIKCKSSAKDDIGYVSMENMAKTFNSWIWENERSHCKFINSPFKI